MQWLALKHTPEAAPSAPMPLAPSGPEHPDWLGTWALQFTPRVAWVEEAWLLEVSTTLRLWAGMPGLLDQLHTRWRQLGVAGALHAHAGPTALAALARWRASAGPSPQHSPHLADLPLHTLGAARPHLAALARMGVHTWGQLDRLPRTGVARRWGNALLLALDQGLGRATESYPWLVPPAGFDQGLDCSHAIDTALALMQPATQLLAALHAWLLAGQRGALALRWQWTHDSRRDTPAEGGFDLHLPQPTQHLHHLLELTAEHLARTTLAAPVLTLRLHTLAHAPCVPPSGELHFHAASPAGSAPSPHDWAELLARLRARLGPQAVLQWHSVATHWPDAMQQAHPAPATPMATPHGHGGPVPPHTAAASTLPTWLLRHPQALRTTGQRPDFLGPLELLAGPQRLELTHWPRHTPAPPPTAAPGSPPPAAPLEDWASHRDYFVARSPGAGLVWVFRTRPLLATPPRWFLHGWFA